MPPSTAPTAAAGSSSKAKKRCVDVSCKGGLWMDDRRGGRDVELRAAENFQSLFKLRALK